jgi:hypothetical protein
VPALWDFVAGLDLSALLGEIRAVAGHPGRPAIDPAILLSLWLYATLNSVETVSDRTTVYAPVMEPKDKSRDPHRPRPDDTEAIGAWRVRMGTEAAQQIYKERAATAECVNALARNRGLRQIPVRGTAKALAVMLLFALPHNMMRAITLLGG